MKFFTCIFLLALSLGVSAQNGNSSRKYFTTDKDATHKVLYIKDVVLENALSGENKSVTEQRYNNIAGITQFKRTGNGFFRMVVDSRKLTQLMLQTFHFTESEIALGCKSTPENFK